MRLRVSQKLEPVFSSQSTFWFYITHMHVHALDRHLAVSLEANLSKHNAMKLEYRWDETLGRSGQQHAVCVTHNTYL